MKHVKKEKLKKLMKAVIEDPSLLRPTKKTKKVTADDCPCVTGLFHDCDGWVKEQNRLIDIENSLPHPTEETKEKGNGWPKGSWYKLNEALADWREAREEEARQELLTELIEDVEKNFVMDDGKVVMWQRVGPDGDWDDCPLTTANLKQWLTSYQHKDKGHDK